MSDTNSLEKMRLMSFKKKDFTGDKKEFEIPINPESFTKSYKVDYEVKKAPGSGKGTNGRFNSTKPEEFKIEFTLDGTYVVQGYRLDKRTLKNKDKADEKKGARPDKNLVEVQLKTFLDTVYEMESEIHRPRFCKIFWGGGDKHLFQGILSNLDINYTLFHPTGHPLRIKINATFLDYIAKEEREKRSPKKSPDLTRIKTTKAGDRLEQMVYEIYDDPKFIVQVARANDLTSFRQLDTNTEIRFPPIDKTEVL